jgi:hypothetical protein
MTTLSVHDFVALSRTQQSPTQSPIRVPGEPMAIRGVSEHLDRSKKPASPPRDQQTVARVVLPSPPACQRVATLNEEIEKILNRTLHSTHPD